jgi:hypothetical protein
MFPLTLIVSDRQKVQTHYTVLYIVHEKKYKLLEYPGETDGPVFEIYYYLTHVHTVA